MSILKHKVKKIPWSLKMMGIPRAYRTPSPKLPLPLVDIVIEPLSKRTPWSQASELANLEWILAFPHKSNPDITPLNHKKSYRTHSVYISEAWRHGTYSVWLVTCVVRLTHKPYLLPSS